jgi:hypothetical protein
MATMIVNGTKNAALRQTESYETGALDSTGGGPADRDASRRGNGNVKLDIEDIVGLLKA